MGRVQFALGSVGPLSPPCRFPAATRKGSEADEETG